MHDSQDAFNVVRGLQMMTQFVLQIVIASALAYPTHASLFLQKGSDAKKEEQAMCWPGEPEIQNANPGKHRPSRLPRGLAKEKVKRSVILLKLCVSDTGNVARVLVLRSSGNAAVDDYYVKDLSSWTFTPVEHDKRNVRSVVPVTVTLYMK
jgi:hypothetical protein